ncbi:MAG: hypothetical protein A2Y73_05315 [Chloroflexi bacterium RBG_13_56_8]|nr:MAG: hypothetical protein A2Y73_05315 [Chloroflexi bacterium RBG_13_56_8]
MQQKYEYKFVRLGEGTFWVKRAGSEQYQTVVHEHAQQGWRLVQIFAPGTGVYGSAKYYELIFEREHEDSG